MIRFRSYGLLGGVWLLACAGAAYGQCTGGNTQTFTSTGGGSAPYVSGAVTKGVPYPLSVTIPSTFTGTITCIEVTLNGFSFDGNAGASTSGLGLLLEKSGGTNFEILRGPTDGAGSATNVTLQIADNGTATMPNQSQEWGSFSPVYKPGSFGPAGSYPSPGPGAAAHVPAANGSATLNGTFGGAAAAGTWNLYIINTSGFTTDNITFSSYALTITTAALNSTQTSLTTSTNPAFTGGTGNTTTLTATVTSPGNGTVTTGSVVFKDNGNTISCGAGSQAFSNGVQTCVVAFSGATEGFHTMTADFSAASSWGSSTGTVSEWLKNHTTNPGGTQFCNTGPITIPFGSSPSPYPSIVTVSGVPNSVSTLTLTLNTLHQLGNFAVGSLKMLLASPDGAHALEFLNTTGASNGTWTSTVTISDSASGLAPASSAFPATVSYVPTSLGTDHTYPTPPSPAPAPPASFHIGQTAGTGTMLNSFSGATSNGDWKLFIDAAAGHTASSVDGGWCINITPNSGIPTVTWVTSSTNPARTGQPVTLTATVRNGNDNSLIQNGTVTFTENGAAPAGNAANTITLVNGVAAYTTSGLAEGDHVITATYNDVTNTNSLSFGTITQRLDSASTFTNLNSNPITVCNPGTIAVPGGTFPNNIGPANVNPSNLFVTGVPGTTQSVAVTLKQYNLFDTTNLASLLVGPGAANANTLDFFSGAGGSPQVGPFDLTFADSAGTLVPTGNGNPASGGPFKPTSYNSGDTFFASPFYTLPAGPYQYAGPAGSFTLNGLYGGGNKDPNGTWSLYFNLNLHAQPGTINGWCLQLTQNAPDVSVVKSHSGNFRQGDIGDTYTVAVSNAGPGKTGGTLTLTDTLPAALTATAMSGTGWDCTGNTFPAAGPTTLTCTSTSQIAAGSGYPAVTLTVNVANNAPASVTNTASIAGSLDNTPANNTSSDGTTIIQTPDLKITKTHSGNFRQGDTGDTYTITVSNKAGAAVGPTSGTVTVTENLPSSLTNPHLSGTNWACNDTLLTCTRTDALAAGGSYEPITLTVDVSPTAPASVTNQVTVSGGGELSINTGDNTASDPTTIVAGSVQVTVSATPAGASFTADGTTYTSAQTLTWTLGTSHTLSTTSPQAGATGVRYVFNNWSDAGAISHNVTASAGTTSYTTAFDTQYQLTTAASPAAGGTVLPASGFFAAGAVVPISATANAGYSFTNWTGAVASPSSASTTVTMTGPQTVTANFTAGAVTMSAGIAGKAGPQNARVWTIRFTNNGPGAATGVEMSNFGLTQVAGAACTPVVGTLPGPIASIGPGASATTNVTIDFTGCAAANRFTVTMPFTANGGGFHGTMTLYNQFQ